MTREELKALGLTDEQVDAVMKSHGKAINSTKEKADKVEGLESQLSDLKGQIAERDGQLEKLKKVDPEALQAEITRLEGENAENATKFQEKLDKQAYDFALDRALSDAKAKNPKAVKALLNTEAIKLDGEKLLGLEEQLKTLAESDGYLFAEKEEAAGSAFRGFTPPGGKKEDGKDKDTSEDFGKSLAQLATKNADLDKARDSYFG